MKLTHGQLEILAAARDVALKMVPQYEPHSDACCAYAGLIGDIQEIVAGESSDWVEIPESEAPIF